MNTLDPSPATSVQPDLSAIVANACKRIAPLWPLQNFVAVNPFLGLSDKTFIDTCELIRKVTPGGMQMSLNFYADKFQAGEISKADLTSALDHAANILPSQWADAAKNLDISTLEKALTQPEPSFAENDILSVADALDRTTGSNWAANITEVTAQFCAAYYDGGQSAWRQPWAALPLYTAWRETAMLDAKPEAYGLKGFRKFAAAQPENADEAIAQNLAKLGLSESQIPDFLHRQLMGISGWAGHIQYLVRENSMIAKEDDSLVQFLAIRLAYEVALLENFDSPELRDLLANDYQTGISNEVLIRFIWQLAHENAWQSEISAKIIASEKAPAQTRPSAQAVFCIDVRSEVFRRALEQAVPAIQTKGFAGFFGMSIEKIPFGQHHGNTQCPALLTPTYRVLETLKGANAAETDQAWKQQRLEKRLSFSWNSFKNSAISCFSFVETAGLGFGLNLFRNSYAPAAKKVGPDCCPSLDINTTENSGIPVEDRAALAQGALTHMGLKSNFARLVLICGHGSETTNNPYGSGLDCGACGGHAGDANARVAAQILNDPAVRESLVTAGIEIPSDTVFLAGLHNTTTDEATIYDVEKVPESHQKDLADLELALAQAGKNTRLERAISLGLDPAAVSLDKQIKTRALDWAEVRPEWGLAGNAAFVAAPRARTKNAKLNGRVFLHDYDHDSDVDEATLAVIMAAPMVVGSWINLQYFASTVNNQMFGSGNKVTHNVTGTLGVCQGNAGDLLTGLPIQSVHNGTDWVHEPLRLHVYLEAPRASITNVMENNAGVKDLVVNGWVILIAMEDEGKSHYRHLPDGTWEKVAG